MDRLIKVTDPLGRETQIEYDAMDRPTRVIANALSPTPQITQLAYNDQAMVRTITNALGQVTTFHMDAADRVTRITNPDGTELQYEHNLAGELVRVVDALGRQETSTYDAAGHKTSETDALGTVTQYQYDAVGNVLSVTNARGQVTTFQYDHQNRITGVIEPLGGVTTMGYDGRGNATSVTNAGGETTTFVYNSSGNLTDVTNNAGETTSLEYSLAGLQTAIELPRGTRVQLLLDALGRVQTETKLGAGGLTASTSFTYDAAGNRTSMTDANGRVWLYTYDSLGRLATTTDPMGFTTAYAYDALGNLVQKQLPNQTCTIDYSYDPLNRLIRKDTQRWGLRRPELRRHGQCDAGGDPRRGRGGCGQQHELRLRRPQPGYPGQRRDHAHPGLQHRLRLQFGGQSGAEDLHPARPGCTGAGGADVGRQQPADQYRATAAPTPSAWPRPIRPAAGWIPRCTGPTASRRRSATTITTARDGSAASSTAPTQACTTVRSQFSYTYDADGNRRSETVLKGGVQTQIGYEVDSLGRLVNEQRQQTIPPGSVAYNTTYSYDPVGNRLQSQDPVTGKSTQTAYDNAHRTTSVMEFQGPQPIRQLVYQYTPSGNLAQRQSTLVQPPAQPLSEQFRYDCDGRLVEYQNLLTLERQASVYDGLGNKVLVAGTAGNKAMVYDGPNVLAEYNMAVPSTPALTATYLFGQEIDEGLARIDAATGNPAFYLKDALGSTRQIVDQVSALKNDYEYKAFGDTFSQLVTVPNDLLFTGRQLDPVSKLYDYRTRVYDPRDGRFLQTDPIYQGLILAPCVSCWQNSLELMTVMPLYAYVGNNPTTYNDPTGEQWWFWHPWWWVSSWPWLYRPYAWWGWWYGPWGWSGLRWWWWRWWWPANPWWGGWWWWQWHWWWGGWWWPWWGNVWWPWWGWAWNWWWWPWQFGWGWWWFPWWWGGWWWPWWWFHWRGWWHWWWNWPFKWGWWCGWWWRWWWPWWWGGFWWPWWWLNWAGWRLPFWLGWGWWWWPWWWGGFWWPWWFGWGWWPWWGGWFWWNWWHPWRPWWWGVWWWGPWNGWGGWFRWPWWWGGFWWPWWWWCGWSLRPWWWLRGGSGRRGGAPGTCAGGGPGGAAGRRGHGGMAGGGGRCASSPASSP